MTITSVQLTSRGRNCIMRGDGPWRRVITPLGGERFGLASLLALVDDEELSVDDAALLFKDGEMIGVFVTETTEEDELAAELFAATILGAIT